jgi:hypothetical protein
LRYPEGGLVPWLVAAAMLVNGAAYWWFSNQRDLRLAVSVSVTEPGPPAPTLTLLREREASSVTPDRSRERPVEMIEETLADAPEALVVGPQALPDVPSDTTSAPSDALQDGFMDPPEPSPVVSAAPEVVTPAASVPEAVPAPERLQCVWLGPGASAAEVNRWGEAVAGTGVTLAGVQTRDQETIAGYRVMVPASSRPEATLAKLAAAGFEGFVIDKDELGSRISVGHFQLRANAERQRAQLHEQGYTSVILPDRKVRKMYWLQLRASTGGLRGAKAALAKKFPGAGPDWRDCPQQ